MKAAAGARKAGAKNARAPTTSSMSDLFSYGDRVKAELQRKSALADDSYPTVYAACSLWKPSLIVVGDVL